MTHEISENYVGGMDGYSQAVCSCGWKSSKHNNWNDYSFTNMSDQVKEHRKLNNVHLNQKGEFK